MREHAALRRPGRARRVDDRRGVVGPYGPRSRVERLLGRRRARLAQLAQRQRAVGAAPVSTTRCSRSGHASRMLLDLRELCCVLAEDDARAGVLQDVATLLGGVRVIDGHAPRRPHRAPQVGQRPLRTRARPGSRHGRPARRRGRSSPPAISSAARPTSAYERAWGSRGSGERIATPECEAMAVRSTASRVWGSLPAASVGETVCSVVMSTPGSDRCAGGPAVAWVLQGRDLRAWGGALASATRRAGRAARWLPAGRRAGRAERRAGPP